MHLRWKQGLKGATHAERWSLLDAEKHAERVFLQEIVSVLCSLSDLGFVDCAQLRATCKLRRWARNKRRIYCTIKCSANQPGAKRTYNWRLANL